MEQLTFYTNPQSRGRIAHWMLEEVGQPYDTIWLDYGTTMKAQPYLALNPMGKVPALQHGDRVVTEGAAIITYLADAFPQAGLMPPDRARFYRWMFFGAGPLEAAVTNKALNVLVPPDKRGFVGYGSLEQVTDVLDQALTDAPYLCGDDFSAADVYLGSQIGFGMMYKTIEARPAFVAYHARISARPALARVAAACDAQLKKD